MQALVVQHLEAHPANKLHLYVCRKTPAEVAVADAMLRS